MGKKQELEAEIVRLTRCIGMQKNIADINDETIGFLCNMHNEDNGRVDEARSVARRLLRERDAAFAKGAEHEASVWSGMILSCASEWWDKNRNGGEFSADDAASMVLALITERDEAVLLLTDCQDRVDRYFAKITSLKSQVQFSEKQNQGLITHHRIERDRAAFEIEALQSQVNHLESDRDALAKQVDELRGALEQVEFVSFADKTWCPWCLNLNHIHNHDCIRQKALRKA